MIKKRSSLTKKKDENGPTISRPQRKVIIMKAETNRKQITRISGFKIAGARQLNLKRHYRYLDSNSEF